MLSKQDIKKLIKRIVRQQQGLRDHQIIHPRRDWAIGLLLGSLLLLIGSAWSIMTYREVTDEDIVSVDPGEEQPTPYREEVVNQALERFRARAVEYETAFDRAEVTADTRQPDEVVEEVTSSESGETETDSAADSVPNTTEPEPIDDQRPPSEPPLDPGSVEVRSSM
jgi:hypothetical protein